MDQEVMMDIGKWYVLGNGVKIKFYNPSSTGHKIKIAFDGPPIVAIRRGEAVRKERDAKDNQTEGQRQDSS